MKSILIYIVLCLSLITGCGKKQPIDKAVDIAERLINETVAETEKKELRPVADIQVIDFNNVFNQELNSICYAKNIIVAKSDTVVELGISSSTPIVIKVKSSITYKQLNSREFKFLEKAYDLYSFQDTVSVNLQKGENKILIKAFVTDNGYTFIRQITPYETKCSIVFGKTPNRNEWLFQKSNEKKFSPNINESKIANNWVEHPKLYQDELVVNPNNVYKRESYYEWHYANGTTMLGLINVNNYRENDGIKNFIKGFCDFTLEKKGMLQYQYEKLHALRTGNYRMFRKSMLDDSGPEAIPFFEVYKENINNEYLNLINEMLDYVVNGQSRLSDGTFCRPEPVEMTVWADDLFMSTQILLKAAELFGGEKYHDDIVNQVENFHKYLWDSNLNLHRHAWFEFEKKQSPIAWSRANGWIIWSISSVLLQLPKEHEAYNSIQNIYKKTIDGLIEYQGENGLWHQVLNRNDSFEETSGSAMFTLAIARGVTNGWLSNDYKKYALKGWEGISNNISDDGIVKDICRGTGIGYDFDFYNNRKRFDNDPRGLGAVLTASVEISKLLNND